MEWPFLIPQVEYARLKRQVAQQQYALGAAGVSGIADATRRARIKELQVRNKKKNGAERSEIE